MSINFIGAYFKFFDNLGIYFKISIQVFSIVLLTFFISRVVKYSFFVVFKYLSRNKSSYTGIIVASKKPLLFFIWLYCFISSIDLFMDNISGDLLSMLTNLKYIITYLSVLIFLLKSISQAKRYYIIQKEKYDASFDYAGIDAIEKFSKVSVIIIWSIFTLGKMGFNLNALLAFGGAGGILVGFAGKDLFTNIFGGLIIYLDKPFVVGDWISSPDRNIEGDVEAIGWRQTRILTFDKFPIYIPNSIFGNIVIENRSRIRSRKIEEEIAVRYMDFAKIDKITEEIMDMLNEHQGISKKYKMFCKFVEIEKGYLVLKLYTFTTTTEFLKFFETKQEILLKITEIILENGAELAHPTQTIDIDSSNMLKSNIIDPIINNSN